VPRHRRRRHAHSILPDRQESFSVDGPPRPTILYGYGGFEVSLTPSYLGITGRLWLEQGHLYALANIRGGGEFGPSWHHSLPARPPSMSRMTILPASRAILPQVGVRLRQNSPAMAAAMAACWSATC